MLGTSCLSLVYRVPLISLGDSIVRVTDYLDGLIDFVVTARGVTISSIAHIQFMMRLAPRRGYRIPDSIFAHCSLRDETTSIWSCSEDPALLLASSLFLSNDVCHTDVLMET